jgi:hypothetical protein
MIFLYDLFLSYKKHCFKTGGLVVRDGEMGVQLTMGSMSEIYIKKKIFPILFLRNKRQHSLFTSYTKEFCGNGRLPTQKELVQQITFSHF